MTFNPSRPQKVVGMSTTK